MLVQGDRLKVKPGLWVTFFLTNRGKSIKWHEDNNILGVTLNQDTDLKSKDQFPGPKSKKMSFWSVVDN